MKGIVRGVLGLALAAGMAGCTNDATVDLGGEYNTVDVDKNALFVRNGDSSAVLVRLVDDLRASTPASFTVSNVGAGVRVTYDETYRPDYTQGDTLIAPLVKPQQRYWVVGTAIGQYEVTFTAGGSSTTIRAYVTPRNLGAAALSTTTAAGGDIVTITAPAGLRFSPTSAVTFPTGQAVFITNRAADGSSISFMVFPNTTGAATVTLVTQDFAPGAPPVSLVTPTTLTVPQQTVAMSTTNAPFGGSVTLTAPGAARFSPTSVVAFPGGSIVVTNRAADGSTITFQAGPNISGVGTVTLVNYPGVPGSPTTTLSTANALNSTVVASVPTTVSNATPNIGESVTITLGNNMRYTATTKVLIGGREAGFVSVSADSSSAVIMPMTGSAGTVTFTNIVLSNLTTLPISLPSDGKTITVTSTFAGTPANGTGTLATAPLIATPVKGRSIIITDVTPFFAGGPCGNAAFGGTSGCRIYKFTLPEARTVDAEIRWEPTNADLGVFRIAANGTTGTFIADSFGGQVGGPEVSAAAGVALPAGDNYIVVGTFGGLATPAWFQVRLTFR